MTPPAAQTSDTDLTPSASPSSNETDEALSPPDIHNPEISLWEFNEDVFDQRYFLDITDYPIFEDAQLVSSAYGAHPATQHSQETGDGLACGLPIQKAPCSTADGPTPSGSRSVDAQEPQMDELFRQFVHTRESTPLIQRTNEAVFDTRDSGRPSAAARRILQTESSPSNATGLPIYTPQPKIKIPRADIRQLATRSTKVDQVRYFCEFEECDRSFTRDSGLTRHMQTVHQLGNELYACGGPDCDHINYRKDKMIVHRRVKRHLEFKTLDAKSRDAANRLERKSRQQAESKCTECGSKTKPSFHPKTRGRCEGDREFSVL